MQRADVNVNHLEPRFRGLVEKLLVEMRLWCNVHLPHCEPRVVEGYRSESYQHALWLEGRAPSGRVVSPGEIVTDMDGYVKRSAHQSSLAVDVAPENMATGAIEWNEEAFFSYLGHIARLYGLEWGGAWTSLKDVDHVQVPFWDVAWYREARAFQRSVGIG